MTRQLVADGVYQRQYGNQLAEAVYTDPTLSRQVMGSLWKLDGACTDRNEADWFDAERSLATRRARAVCFACPLQRVCLASAIAYAEEFGVWGGLTPSEREPLMIAVASGLPVDVVVDRALGGREARRARAS